MAGFPAISQGTWKFLGLMLVIGLSSTVTIAATVAGVILSSGYALWTHSWAPLGYGASAGACVGVVVCLCFYGRWAAERIGLLK